MALLEEEMGVLRQKAQRLQDELELVSAQRATEAEKTAAMWERRALAAESKLANDVNLRWKAAEPESKRSEAAEPGYVKVVSEVKPNPGCEAKRKRSMGLGMRMAK